MCRSGSDQEMILRYLFTNHKKLRKRKKTHWLKYDTNSVLFQWFRSDWVVLPSSLEIQLPWRNKLMRDQRQEKQLHYTSWSPGALRSDLDAPSPPPPPPPPVPVSCWLTFLISTQGSFCFCSCSHAEAWLDRADTVSMVIKHTQLRWFLLWTIARQEDWPSVNKSVFFLDQSNTALGKGTRELGQNRRNMLRGFRDKKEIMKWAMCGCMDSVDTCLVS